MSVLIGKRILVGVCGSIAAFKAAELVRALRKEEADVTVAMTVAAMEFIGPATFAAFTEHPVMMEQFPEDPASGVPHVEIADTFDLVVVAPATANMLGKASQAVADDLLSTILNIFDGPILFVPAMNTRMWNNPATREAVEKLRSWGRTVLEPDTGELATRFVGEGRFPETVRIMETVETLVGLSGLLEGKRVLVTAGPTREPIDPVRYISNRSSGKMGYALAAAAHGMGAEVILISGPTALPPPGGCRTVSIETVDEMLAAVQAELAGCDYLIMAAAVADFQVDQPAAEKIKRSAGPPTLVLKPAPDILGKIRGKFKGTVVSFSLQPDNSLETAREKQSATGADFTVVNNYNEPAAGFDTDTNHVWVLPREGAAMEIALASKEIVARGIWEILVSAQDVVG